MTGKGEKQAGYTQICPAKQCGGDIIVCHTKRTCSIGEENHVGMGVGGFEGVKKKKKERFKSTLVLEDIYQFVVFPFLSVKCKAFQ